MSNSFPNPTATVTYSMSADDFEALIEKMKAEGRQEALAELAAKNALDKPTVTRKDAMRQLGISESTIISWGRRGLIRFIKRGHQCLYSQADIDRILVSGTNSAQPPF